MDSSIFHVNGTDILGRQINQKKCFESRDEHFTCLDSVGDRYDNHYKCNQTYEIWKRNCSDGDRNLHMTFRDREKINNRLYTQEQLDDYNKRKNLKTYPTPNSY